VALHFSPEELAERRARACALMTEDGLDGLLMFRQESMYYLTGYDTFGYVFFQCLYLGADGRTVLLTRAPDLRQAHWTSVIEDVRVWVDGPEAEPAEELRRILEHIDDDHRQTGLRLAHQEVDLGHLLDRLLELVGNQPLDTLGTRPGEHRDHLRRPDDEARVLRP